VLLTNSGAVIAEGFHRGAGKPHAEAVALSSAGPAVSGATVVVTLEPCAHVGRTPACAHSLISAGVRRVVFAQSDKNPVAAGGADILRAAGVEVVGGLLAEQAADLNQAWTFAIAHGRPLVTWKFASTLDGRTAAADGSSRWITSRAARRDVHRLRQLADAVLVGTNTVAIDDPALTVRDEDGKPHPTQPVRAVMGLRELDPRSRIFDQTARTVLLRTRDPAEALKELLVQDQQHVLLEGGSSLASAFLSAGLVDEVVAYLAPTFLGAGRSVLGDVGIGTIADAREFDLVDVQVIGTAREANLRLMLTHRKER
jgi:diaminohydroxyphosphoribosylaminopyrimidine deaminase / 5-amino-6-(5-phosphoribosylamino)uracil reductase